MFAGAVKYLKYLQSPKKDIIYIELFINSIKQNYIVFSYIILSSAILENLSGNPVQLVCFFFYISTRGGCK